MKKIVLIRHGESTWNQENRFTGWKDVTSPREASRKRDRPLLAAEGYDFDFASPRACRAVKTPDIVLEEMDRLWLPVEKHAPQRAPPWRCRAEQGRDRGEVRGWQVLVWRRSYDVPPPALDPSDERNAARDRRYARSRPARSRSANASRTPWRA
jgi:2,3-bisphosphoglycerate-dependent phosphoglycerate mutase